LINQGSEPDDAVHQAAEKERRPFVYRMLRNINIRPVGLAVGACDDQRGS
jgi:hypothetical protein